MLKARYRTKKGNQSWFGGFLLAEMKKRSREEHTGAQGKQRIKAKRTTAKEGSFDFDARRWTKTWFTLGAERGWKDKEE